MYDCIVDLLKMHLLEKVKLPFVLHPKTSCQDSGIVSCPDMADSMRNSPVF